MFLQYHQTPLHNAAIGCSTDIVQLLIDKGADIDAKDKVRCDGILYKVTVLLCTIISAQYGKR